MTGNLQSPRRIKYDTYDNNTKIWIRPRFLGHKKTQANSEQTSPCNEIMNNQTLYVICYLEWRNADCYTHGVISRKTEMFISTAVKTSNYERQFAVFGPLIQTGLPITYFLRALSSICAVRNKEDVADQLVQLQGFARLADRGSS